MKRALDIFRLCLCLMMILSITARAAIPAGFMPEQRQDGKVEIVICSSLGLSSIFVDAKDSPYPQQEHPDGKTGHRDICPYAPVLAQNGLPPSVVLVLPIMAKNEKPLPPAAVTSKRLAAKAYQSQAPPLFS